MGRKRDKNGRFAKGDTGGPGRSTRAREDQYWRICKSTVSTTDWKAIISKAVKQAKSGDTQARKFLLDILVGDPNKLRQDASNTPAPLVETVSDVVTVLAQELAGVQGFELDARRTALVAKLAGEIIKALSISDLEQRLAELEAKS